MNCFETVHIHLSMCGSGFVGHSEGFSSRDDKLTGYEALIIKPVF